MKAVILAGGYGTRISEESGIRPKPMVEIGGKPILWHIMKIYAHHGINDFIICCGYKGYVIKEYFSNYFVQMSDIRIDMANNKMEVLNKQIADWNYNYPVGSGVTVAGYKKELNTRTEAMVLFGHRAAVYLQGYKGYFALDDVTPVG